MHYPHRIRLKAPWECRLQTDTPAIPSRRVAVPGTIDELGLPVPSHGILTRRFGYPGKIDAGEHVWLTFTDAQDQAEAKLNGHHLGAWTGAFEVDVTQLLSERNRLEVDLHATSARARLGEVAMEIRRDAYLQGFAVRRDAQGAIHLEGTVAGATSEALEIYVMLDGRHVYYEMLKQVGGLQIAISPEESLGHRLRLELISVSTVWYALEMELGGQASVER